MMTVEQTANLLAVEHAREDEGIRQVLWAPAEDEVRLVEITTSVTDRGEVLPFRFAPDPPDILYPSVVILLSPGDWDRVQEKKLELPVSFGDKLDQLYTR